MSWQISAIEVVPMPVYSESLPAYRWHHLPRRTHVQSSRHGAAKAALAVATPLVLLMTWIACSAMLLLLSFCRAHARVS